MDQETRWLMRYNEAKRFIEENKRNPSKHRIEEHDMLNWVKQQRKLVNAGTLKPDRIEQFKELLGMFKELLVLCEQHKRKNQWE